MQNPSAPQWLTEAASACGPMICECTVPIVAGDDNPTSIGSGVLLAIGQDWLVLTASHVVQPGLRFGARFGIVSSRGVVMLPSTLCIATSGSDADLVDAAVLLLNPTERDRLHDAGFVPIRQGALANNDRSNPQFLMAGYPVGLITNTGHQSNLRPALLASGEAQTEIPRFDPLTQLRLAYPSEEHALYPDGDNVNHIAPHGFSGGGVWSLFHDARAWSPGSIRLTAIVISFVEQMRTLRCTRISTHLDLLVRADPETGRGFGRALSIIPAVDDPFPHVVHRL